jgi:hypothetical protein
MFYYVSHFEWWHKIPMVVKNRIVKLMLANSYFFILLKETKYEKIWSLKIRKKFMHFLKAFCSLDMIIRF